MADLLELPRRHAPDLRPRASRPDFWGYCRRCGHSLLVTDLFCPSCFAPRGEK